MHSTAPYRTVSTICTYKTAEGGRESCGGGERAGRPLLTVAVHLVSTYLHSIGRAAHTTMVHLPLHSPVSLRCLSLWDVNGAKMRSMCVRPSSSHPPSLCV
jgi:hypothetical protein